MRWAPAIVVLFVAATLSGCARAPVTSSVPAVAVWDPEDLSPGAAGERGIGEVLARSEEHTSELQSLS